MPIVNAEPTNIQGELDQPEEMQLCPLCDNPIAEWELAALVTAFGWKGLAHADCVREVCAGDGL